MATPNDELTARIAEVGDREVLQEAVWSALVRHWPGPADGRTVDAAKDVLAQVRAVLGETTTEWGVKHSQGIRHETSERYASEWAAATNERNKGRYDFETRHKASVVTREVTPWTEVTAPPAPKRLWYDDASGRYVE